ncbi:CpaF family protein, partial [Streptomyces sp. NPDC005122]
TIERIVSTVNRRVDESNPMVDARLSARQDGAPVPSASLPSLDVPSGPRSTHFRSARLLLTTDGMLWSNLPGFRQPLP